MILQAVESPVKSVRFNVSCGDAMVLIDSTRPDAPVECIPVPTRKRPIWRRKVGVLGVFAVLVAGIGLLGMPANAASLPPGATELVLATEPATWHVPFVSACELAALVPVRIERDGNGLVFASVDTGEHIPVVWPH
ncbi:MAG: hypothetical protein ACRDGQ_00240, partial [Candidatus Limnocylindrales bacterium]